MKSHKNYVENKKQYLKLNQTVSKDRGATRNSSWATTFLPVRTEKFYIIYISIPQLFFKKKIEMMLIKQQKQNLKN